MTNSKDVVSLLTDPRQTGQGKWQCKCPAHDDGKASLSVTQSGGKWLFHCHAGCQTASVLAALGLSFADVAGVPMPHEQSIEYKYLDENGVHVYSVLRLPGKEFRQRRANGTWSMKDVRRVPYNLPEVLKADVVFIAEGEKDVETLRRAGLVATTNVGGAGKWQKSFLEYFGGKTVYILPDNDQAGRDHAIDVRAKLGHGTIIEIPGLPPKGDVSDWFQAGGSREKLELLIEEIGGNRKSHGDNPHNSKGNERYRHDRKSDTQKTAIPELHQFVPFPTNALPSAVAEFVQQTARSICCDESFVALPILAGLASAIGNSHALRIKNGWNPPPIVWCAVVSPSGTAKTAPLRQALRPIYSRQKRLLKDFDKAFEKFQKDYEVYIRDLADFKKSKDPSKEPPKPPEEPACGRVVVDDTTIEALGKRLRDNPRGILLAKDELSTWFSSFARYKAGSSSDEAKWLEFFGAQTSIIDRASSTRPIVIDRASVCISGTIQPAILKTQLTNERKSSGLAARLLFAMPPMRVKQWTEFEVSQRVEDDVNAIFDALFSLEMRADNEGNLLPSHVRLEPSAKQRFVRYYNEHNREQQHLDGDLYAAYSKLEEYAARFALIVHCTEYAANPTGRTLGLLTLDSMQRGIELCEWFKNEAKRVYAVLSESDIVTENRQLINWCSLQSEPVTPYQLYRHQRNLGDSESAEKLLQQFVENGFGEWVEIPPTNQGGKPTRGFQFTGDGANPNKPTEITRLSPQPTNETAVLGEVWLDYVTDSEVEL